MQHVGCWWFIAPSWMQLFFNSTLLMQCVPVKCCFNCVHNHSWYYLTSIAQSLTRRNTKGYSSVTLYEKLIYEHLIPSEIRNLWQGCCSMGVKTEQCLYLHFQGTVYFPIRVEGHCPCLYPLLWLGCSKWAKNWSESKISLIKTHWLAF